MPNLLYTKIFSCIIVYSMKPTIPQKLPIKDVNWEQLIPLIGRANRSIAYYDGVLHGVPNPAVLLAPLTTQDAVLSSSIEGTQASLGEVLKYEAGEEPVQESRRQDIQEILNYRKALREAEKELKTKPFNLNLLLKLHAILLDSVRGRDKSRGQIRSTQNWIGAVDTPIEKAYFVPPEPAHLMEHLYAWEKYYHCDRPDALVQLAIVHAQFEIIHPFLDGNGRIGRILIPLFLFEKKLLSRPMFYLSAWLDEHRDEYIKRLRLIDKQDGSWNNLIEFFLTGIDEQAKKNADKAREIMKLYDEMKVKVLGITRSQFATPLIDQIFETPIFQSSHLKFKPVQPSRPQLNNMLVLLKKSNILKVIREGSGRRGTVYVFADLLNLCEGKKAF
jgi:Fic family protein